jgi:hypothetical protein
MVLELISYKPKVFNYNFKEHSTKEDVCSFLLAVKKNNMAKRIGSFSTISDPTEQKIP